VVILYGLFGLCILMVIMLLICCRLMILCLCRILILCLMVCLVRSVLSLGWVSSNVCIGGLLSWVKFRCMFLNGNCGVGLG